MNRLKIKQYEKFFFLLCILFGAVCFLTACMNPTATIEGLIPLISAIIGIVGSAGEAILPAESSLIAAGVTLVINGLNALLVALKSYDANKTATGALATLQAAFMSAHENLGVLLTAAGVKNQTLAQRIGGVVNGVISVVSTIEAYIISKAPTSST